MDNEVVPREMNDPHVVALKFRVKHGSTVAYRDDAPHIEHQDAGFRILLSDGTVRIELDGHHATQAEALEEVGPYVRSWEMDACLSGKPGDFCLEFLEAEIIDRDPPPPTPGVVNLAITGSLGALTGHASLSIVKPSYPAPPKGLTLKADDPDVMTMYRRLSGYYEGHEPLPSMANFCLTVLEHRFNKGRRRAAAKAFNIDKTVLDAVGALAATKGGADSARKAGGAGTPLSGKEERFLIEAVTKIIRRVAEAAQNPTAAYPPIGLADLPDRT